MKRLLSSFALAAALMLPAATTPAFASSVTCNTTSAGSTSYSTCYDWGNGGMATGSSTSVGDTTYHSGYGSDGSYTSGTTTRVGDSTYTTINTWP